ncbi:hypothetical protein HX793_30730, partial [Pseudomonas reactans]|uniref:hypothetical protein n=1 Tax=Pseudomonas reactans TaxID=117680 RepID=UPI0015BE8297|nr:hypothetical protein [Pseudomonas reactans]
MGSHKGNIPDSKVTYAKTTMFLRKAYSFPGDFSFTTLQLTMAPEETSHELLNIIRDRFRKNKNRSPIDLSRRKDREDELETTSKGKRLVFPVINPAFDFINKAFTVFVGKTSGDERNPKVSDRERALRKLNNKINGSPGPLTNITVESFTLRNIWMEARNPREFLKRITDDSNRRAITMTEEKKIVGK